MQKKIDVTDDDSEMIAFRARLASFKNWPFDESCNCTPEKMAEAGFYLVGSVAEPDLVRCYYCRRELDGWEPEDIPVEEHKRRRCPFIEMGKSYKELTSEDVMDLEAERYCAILQKKFELDRDRFLIKAEEAKRFLEQLGKDKTGSKRRKK